MTKSELALFFLIAFSFCVVVLVYTQRADRHRYCMIECMGDNHSEIAYAECAAAYSSYTNDYCEPLR